jgi:hypothetical protein
MPDHEGGGAEKVDISGTFCSRVDAVHTEGCSMGKPVKLRRLQRRTVMKTKPRRENRVCVGSA